MTPRLLPTGQERLWTVKEASEWLAVTEQALRSMLKRREVPREIVFKLGRRVRFRPDLLREWVLGRHSA